MLFSLVHNPCSTTIYTIWKETRSVKWTALSTLLPLGMGIIICFLVTQVWRSLTLPGTKSQTARGRVTIVNAGSNCHNAVDHS